MLMLKPRRSASLGRHLQLPRVALRVPGLGVRDRRPFATAGEDRRPTLSWLRQLPVDGEPAAVVEIVKRYGQWMSRVEIPKLFASMRGENSTLLRQGVFSQ